MSFLVGLCLVVGGCLVVGFIIRTGKKSVAAVAVQNALEHAQWELNTSVPSATLANAIVACYIDARPELFSGFFGTKLNSSFVALGALAFARRTTTNGELSKVVQSALGQMVVRVGREGISRASPMTMDESEVLTSSYAIYHDTSLD